MAVLIWSCAGSGANPSTSSAGITPSTEGASTSLTPDCPPPGDSPGGSGVGDPVLPFLGNGGYEVSHYDLELFIDPPRNHLQAVVSIEASATQALTSFNLDYAGPSISDLTTGQQRASFCRIGGELIVTPDSMIEEGESFVVTVRYAGTPEAVMRPGAPAEGWVRVSEEHIMAGGLWGSKAAFMPLNATDLDKATFHMAITTPEGLAAAGVGTLVDVIESDEATTYIWMTDVPTAPSRVLIATGRFELESAEGPGGVVYENLMPPDTPTGLRDNLDKATPVLAALSEVFGPFPFDRLGFTFIPDHPAMNAVSAHTRIVVLGLTGIGDAFLAHEIAHQWFGNSVTPATTQDDWLSEGFATYAEALSAEASVGRDASDTLADLWWQRMGESTRRLAVVDAPQQLGDYVAYFRGAATLHALRAEVGDEAFFRVLSRFASDFRHSAATTEDFISIAEAESDVDLSDFFDSWLYSEAVPPMPDDE